MEEICVWYDMGQNGVFGNNGIFWQFMFWVHDLKISWVGLHSIALFLMCFSWLVRSGLYGDGDKVCNVMTESLSPIKNAMFFAFPADIPAIVVCFPLSKLIRRQAIDAQLLMQPNCISAPGYPSAIAFITTLLDSWRLPTKYLRYLTTALSLFYHSSTNTIKFPPLSHRLIHNEGPRYR